MVASAPAAGNGLPPLHASGAARASASEQPQAEQHKDKAAAASRDFESVFLTQMVEQMMKTVKLGGMDGGHAQEIWRSFLARAIADQIANTGTTGIAQSVDRVLKAYKDSAT